MTSKRQWSATDRGMAHLVRLVLDEDWQPARAAARLREQVADQRVLRHMAARVQRALTERPSEVARRAALTLSRAIDDPRPHGRQPHRPPRSFRWGAGPGHGPSHPRWADADGASDV
jgi:hypothetical protein